MSFGDEDDEVEEEVDLGRCCLCDKPRRPWSTWQVLCGWCQRAVNELPYHATRAAVKARRS